MMPSHFERRQTMRRFKIEMKTILGLKIGELSFSENGEAISGTINLLLKKNDIHGFLEENGDIFFSGNITTIIRTIPFRADGRIENGRITLVVHTANNNFTLTGAEITDETNDTKGKEI